ncbi:MAG: methyltransferase [Magnetococcales bacterium]|nr:methyltransferase [Magnetococcales bacterium]
MEDESIYETTLCRDVGSSVDGQLLADFVKTSPGDQLAELGTGCGEVMLQIAKATPGVKVDGLEIQEELVEIARKRVINSPVNGDARVLLGDVITPPAVMRPGSYDHVFTNPPFFKVSAGRLPPDKKRAIARFEQRGTLADFITCGERLLRVGGVFSLIHRAERREEIIAELKRVKLNPTRLLPIQDNKNSETILILMAAKKGEELPMVVEPALLIKEI